MYKVLVIGSNGQLGLEIKEFENTYSEYRFSLIKQLLSQSIRKLLKMNFQNQNM